MRNTEKYKYLIITNNDCYTIFNLQITLKKNTRFTIMGQKLRENIQQY
jgi:hypothetical protein